MKYLLFSILPLKKYTHTHIYINPTLTQAPNTHRGSLDFYPHQAVPRSSSPWQCHLRPLEEPRLSTTTATTTTTTT